MSRSLLAVSALSLAASSVAFAQVPVKLVAIQGQTVTGSGADVVNVLNNPSVNGLGQVAFTGTLNASGGTVGFVFVHDGIKFRNDSVAGVTGVESQMGASNAGDFIFSPSVGGNDAVYTSAGVLLKETDPAPEFAGFNSVFNSRPYMTADGTAFWIGGIGPATSTTTRVFYKAAPRTGGGFDITPALAGGKTIGSDTITLTGIDFAYGVSDNANHFINRVTFSGSTASDAAVVLGASTVVAREGSTPAGGTSAWQNFRSVDINDAGDYLVYGDDASTVDDILTYNGTVILRQGQTLGGETLGSTIDAAGINNRGEIAMIWDLPGTNQEALFVGPASNIGSAVLLLRTGQGIDTTGDSVADYVVTDFNASSAISNPLDFGDIGLVYVDVDLTPVAGGSSLGAIIAVTVPEPGTLSLLAGAGLLALRRRRG
jgi:hypothetical protein